MYSVRVQIHYSTCTYCTYGLQELALHVLRVSLPTEIGENATVSRSSCTISKLEQGLSKKKKKSRAKKMPRNMQSSSKTEAKWIASLQETAASKCLRAGGRSTSETTDWMQGKRRKDRKREKREKKKKQSGGGCDGEEALEAHDVSDEQFTGHFKIQIVCVCILQVQTLITVADCIERCARARKDISPKLFCFVMRATRQRNEQRQRQTNS